MPAPRPLFAPSVRAAAAYVTLFTALGAYFPYLPVYFRARGLDVGVIGLLAAMAALIGLVASPYWGSLADRPATARISLVAAALVAALGATLLAFAEGVVVFAVAAAITAAGANGVAPILDARALDTVGADRHRYGRLRAWGSIAFIAGSAAVGWLIERTDLRVLFAVYVPALLLTALIGVSLHARVAPAVAAAHGSMLAGARVVLRQPVLAGFLIVALATWSSLFAFTALFSVYLAELGVPAGVIGLAWALGAVVEIPVMLAFPSLAGRFGIERLLAVGAALFAIRALGAALTTDAAVLVGLNAVAGLGFALLLVGGVSYVASHAPPGLAATSQGVLTAATFGLATVLGSSIGGIVGSLITVRGLFVACAIAGGISTVAMIAVMRRGRRLIAEGAATAP